MSKSVRNIGIFFLRFHGYIVLVAFAVVVVMSDWSVESFLLPLDDVPEGRRSVPDSIGDEPVLVAESPDLLVVDVSSGETQVWEIVGSGSIHTKVGVDAGDAPFVGSVESGDSVPNFPLYFEVVLEVVDDSVVLFRLCFVVILIEFAGDVLGRVGVLVRKSWVRFVLESRVFFDESEVGLLFRRVEDGEGVIFLGSESTNH